MPGVGAVDAATDAASPALEAEACEPAESKHYQTCLVDAWRDGDSGAGEDASYAMELTGSVEAIEQDVRCTGVGGTGYGGIGYAIRVVGDGEGLTLGFSTPWHSHHFEVGDTIHVKYQRDPEPLASGLPPSGSVVIRDTEGQLLYWIVEAFDGFDALEPPPELSIRNGPTSCSHEDGDCDSATRSSLIVDGGNGPVELQYGEMRNIDDFVVVHAGNERQENPDGTTCARANHRISVIAARGSLVTLGVDPGTSF
jgi:hypothetical protein